ncbi:MAG TPA: NADP-dependent isocitrate dehydrogenase [Firmicutes bacterium]|nr:NADP-dependent isocitrate dehydrogenase [Bacillota bacterium]
MVGVVAGDGVGPEIWEATRPVLEAAVARAYGGAREIVWLPLEAGESSYLKTGQYLPLATLDAIRACRVAIKGPLTTPVGGGFRSVNVALRQVLDLYACVRPVRWFRGLPSPLRQPEQVDLVIFRENTEDVYAGIEWPAGSQEVRRLVEFLADSMGVQIRGEVGIGIKPISREGSRRLVRKAIRYALERSRKSVTLVHKGNIMKYTEGAFCRWGYELVEDEFPGAVVREDAPGAERVGGPEDAVRQGAEVDPAQVRLAIRDRIADNMLQQLITRPGDYDVIAAPNLNGDYLSDVAAALVGGLGVAPGANMSDEVAVFEPTHGSVPKYAGQGKANPTSLILSGAMMLEHMGWEKAARLVYAGIEEVIASGTVTQDLARMAENPNPVSTAAFGAAVAEWIAEQG